MTARYFRSADGAFLGAFVGSPPPGGAIEVAAPPQDARATWNGARWVEPPPPPRWLLKSTIYARMTDEELAALDAAVAAAPVRLRRAWDDAVEIDPDMPLVRDMAVQLFGAQRAAEILA
jgi:hypothetical protein